jgi:hypothetical protein
MTTPINPASPPTWPLTLTGPSDGEAATSSTVNGPFQSLIDASESARLITYGQTRRYMSVDNAGNLSVGPLVAVTLKVGGVWQTYTNAVPLTKALAGLVVNTLYNVYVYYSAGLQLQVSLDPVDDYRLYKDGDEGYAFVGYVMTNFAANTCPARFNGTTYTYALSQGTGFGLNGNLVLDQGGATATTAVLLTQCVPIYAQSATLQARSVRVGLTGSFLVLSEAGDPVAEADTSSAFPVLAPITTSPSVAYFVTSLGDTLTLWVTSFTI